MRLFLPKNGVNFNFWGLQNSSGVDGNGGAVVGEFFAADVEGVEGVGAVGAVFEEVFFGFGELFTGFVFAEAVAASADSGSLDSED